MSGNKVLVVTKPDGTTHIMPVANKASLMSYNSQLKNPAEKWKFEEMDEEEAQKLPYKRTDFVSPVNAQAKLAEKDAEIARLKALLDEKKGATTEDTGAAYNATDGGAPFIPPASGNAEKATALEMIELINKAESEDAIQALIENESRKTVLEAAAKKKASFTQD